MSGITLIFYPANFHSNNIPGQFYTLFLLQRSVDRLQLSGRSLSIGMISRPIHIWVGGGPERVPHKRYLGVSKLSGNNLALYY